MNINLTLIGQAIAFAIFVGFCMKYVWPPIIHALRERQQRIDDGLMAADEGTRKLAEAEEKSRKLLAEGRKKATQIVDSAEKQAQQIVEQAKTLAQTERGRIVASAQGDIARDVEAAKQNLQARFSALVIDGVSRILQNRADGDDHRSMLNKIVKDF